MYILLVVLLLHFNDVSEQMAVKEKCLKMLARKACTLSFLSEFPSAYWLDKHGEMVWLRDTIFDEILVK